MEINIQKILEKHTFPDSYNLSIGFNSAIKEIITEVLREAANSALVLEEKLNPNNTSEIRDKFVARDFEVDTGYEDYCPHRYSIDSDSITSVINKVKF